MTLQEEVIHLRWLVSRGNKAEASLVQELESVEKERDAYRKALELIAKGDGTSCDAGHEKFARRILKESP